MELIERISTDKIAFLKSMDFKEFKRYSMKCKNDDERKVKFNMMKAFCAANIKARVKLDVYIHSPKQPHWKLAVACIVEILFKDFRKILGGFLWMVQQPILI